LQDKETDVIFLATPHTRHADGIRKSLEAGKAVFVEKPLAVDMDGLKCVCEAIKKSPRNLMVGFNRRFSPLAADMKAFLAGRGPMSVQYRCNAGAAPDGHWVSDPTEGGRIIGEACHFFDFFAFLTGSAPTSVYAAAPTLDSIDDAAVTVTYEDGSVCQLLYASNGPGSYGKERVEAFSGGVACVLEDFRSLSFHADGKCPKPKKLMKADKGHAAEIAAFLDAVREGKPSPITAECLVETTLVTFAVDESIQRGKAISISGLKEKLATVD